MDMRITISKEQFDRLHGNELGRTLIQPAIIQVRGKSLQRKKEVYERLTPGQKSLFSFWVLYGHIQSGWLEFYLGGYGQYLPMISKGLEQVRTTALLDNLHQAEICYLEHEAFLKFVQDLREKRGQPNQDTLVVLEKLGVEFAQVDQVLFSLLEKATQQLEDYIRAKPEEFAVFTS